MTSLPFWLTAEHQCSYLDNKTAQLQVADPNFILDSSTYSSLITQGFRRSGNQLYRPKCPACQACIPTRIAAMEFIADRKQQRCLKRNTETLVTIKNPVFDSRHFDLYQHYLSARHDKDQADSISEEEYMHFLSSSWCHTWFVEFSIMGKLAAIAVVDVLDSALSAVYTFFDPEFSNYSPGVYAVLWQIEQAKLLQLDYVYLGFWIKNCRKMQYKSQYQPLSGLIDQQWQPISNQLTIKD